MRSVCVCVCVCRYVLHVRCDEVQCTRPLCPAAGGATQLQELQNVRKHQLRAGVRRLFGQDAGKANPQLSRMRRQRVTSKPMVRALPSTLLATLSSDRFARFGSYCFLAFAIS